MNYPIIEEIIEKIDYLKFEQNKYVYIYINPKWAQKRYK